MNSCSSLLFLDHTIRAASLQRGPQGLQAERIPQVPSSSTGAPRAAGGLEGQGGGRVVGLVFVAVVMKKDFLVVALHCQIAVSVGLRLVLHE